MKLLKILELHREFTTEQTLKNNLGDGFLCAHNKIYQDIRQQTLQQGFKFSETHNERFIALPFAQLEEIFKTHQIPMINNLLALETIPSEILKSIDWNDIEMGYKRNYLFHESCHVVARNIIKKSGCVNKIMNLLLEESFANACELFGMIEAETTAHQIFYNANSYSTVFEDRPRLKSIIKNLGFENCFRFTVLAYLHSNFLFSRYSVADFQQIIHFIFKQDLKKPDLQQLEFLTQMAFSLDETFKMATRALHFKLNQYSEAEFSVLKKDYLKSGFSAYEIPNILDSMVKVFYR